MMNAVIVQRNTEFWNGIGSSNLPSRRLHHVYRSVLERIGGVAYHCLVLNALLLKIGVQASRQYHAQSVSSKDLISKITLLTLASLWAHSHAVQAEPTFMHSFGGTGDDASYSVTTTPDDGIVVAGRTASFGVGSYDEFVAKWWFNGTLAWAKTLGGALDDWGLAVTTTPDGDIILAGTTTSAGAGGYDTTLTKLSTSGTLAWSKILGGPNNEQPSALAITDTGEIVVVGFTRSVGEGGWDFFISLWETSGTLMWLKTLGGTMSDFANTVTITSDGGLVIGGSTDSFGQGNYDMFIAKWSMNSSFSWGTTLGGLNDDRTFDLIPSSDNGIIATGFTKSVGAGNYDAILAKWWGNGTIAWVKTLGASGEDALISLTIPPEGGFIATGYTASYRPSWNLLVTKWSEDATLLWAKVSESYNTDAGSAITVTSDGSIFVAGRTTSYGSGDTNALVTKFTIEGEIANCTSRTTITPTVSSISTSPVSYPAMVDHNWSNPTIQNWNGWIMSDIGQSPKIICPLPTSSESTTTQSSETDTPDISPIARSPSSSTASPSEYDPTGLTVGLVLGVFGITGLTIAGVLGWKKCRSRSENSGNQAQYELRAVHVLAPSPKQAPLIAPPPPYEPPSYPAHSQSAPQYQSTVMQSIPNLGNPNARPGPYQIVSHAHYQSSNNPIPENVYHHRRQDDSNQPSMPGAYAIVSHSNSNETVFR